MIKKEIFWITKVVYITKSDFWIEKREKRSNNKNYSINNKTKVKILSNVRGQYLYSRGKARGITLVIMQ